MPESTIPRETVARYLNRRNGELAGCIGELSARLYSLRVELEGTRDDTLAAMRTAGCNTRYCEEISGQFNIIIARINEALERAAAPYKEDKP